MSGGDGGGGGDCFSTWPGLCSGQDRCYGSLTPTNQNTSSVITTQTCIKLNYRYDSGLMPVLRLTQEDRRGDSGRLGNSPIHRMPPTHRGLGCIERELGIRIGRLVSDWLVGWLVSFRCEVHVTCLCLMLPACRTLLIRRSHMAFALFRITIHRSAINLSVDIYRDITPQHLILTIKPVRSYTIYLEVLLTA